MTSSTHTIQRVAAAIAIAVAVAVLTVPSALASGGCPCNADLPLSANTSRAAETSSPVVQVVRPSGFDWGDFGIGIAAASVGLATVGGLYIGVRQTRQARRSLGTA
jgi:hypothetical protein